MDEKTIAFLQLKQEGMHNPQRPECTTFSMLGYWRRASCARSCLDFKNRLGRADACRSDRSGGEARCCAVCFSLQATVTAVLRMSPCSPERLPLIWLARIAAARGAAPCSQLYQPAGLREEAGQDFQRACSLEAPEVRRAVVLAPNQQPLLELQGDKSASQHVYQPSDCGAQPRLSSCRRHIAAQNLPSRARRAAHTTTRSRRVEVCRSSLEYAFFFRRGFDNFYSTPTPKTEKSHQEPNSCSAQIPPRLTQRWPKAKTKSFCCPNAGWILQSNSCRIWEGGISGEGVLWCLQGANPKCREVSKEECVIRGLLCCPVGSRLVENPFLQHRHQ